MVDRLRLIIAKSMDGRWKKLLRLSCTVCPYITFPGRISYLAANVILIGEFLVRRGAKRAARSVMLDAIAAWSAISAAGKAAQLSEKHEWLLKTAISSRSVDVGCQTVDSLEINRSTEQDHMVMTQNMEDDRKQRWIEQNGVTTGECSFDISGVGLGKLLLFRAENCC